MSGLLLPELLCLAQDLGALHPQEHEHGHDGQQRGHRVRDDVLKQETRLAQGQGHNSSRSECSLRREAIRNALFLQRKVPENPHRKIVNAKLLAPSKTCPNWTNLIYISLASVSKCAVQCGPLWLIVNCGLAPCLIRST